MQVRGTAWGLECKGEMFVVLLAGPMPVPARPTWPTDAARPTATAVPGDWPGHLQFKPLQYYTQYRTILNNTIQYEQYPKILSDIV